MSEPGLQPVAPDQVASPAPGLLRRGARRVLRRAVDAGLVGERLRAHVVVCGFPRSGSTLLQLMVDACVDGVDTFTGEVEGRWAAEHAPRRRPYLLTKRPADVEEVPALRRWYAQHPGRLQVVVTERDPRDVLVSRHAGYPPSRGYYCSPQRWRRVHARLAELDGAADVVRVRYEELVADPAAVQERLTGALGWQVRHPFAQWHEAVRPDRVDRMTRGALGGVRPVDASSVGAWRRPEHAGRVAAVRSALPELDRVLVEQGWAEPGWAEQGWAEEERGR